MWLIWIWRKPNFNWYNDKMNAAICGEHNWISNLLEKKKNKNAAPWIIRPVCLKYNIWGLQWSSPNVKSKQSSGDERTEENQNKTEKKTSREKRAVFMFSEKSWQSYGMILCREKPPPRLSNASQEWMNMSSLLASFPPFPNQTLFYCSTDSATRQIKKTLTKKIK